MCSVTVFGCFSLSPATSAIGCGFVKYKGADSSFYQLRAVEYNLYSANYLYILYTLYTLYSLLFPPSWTIVTLYDSSPTDQRYRLHFCVRLHHLLLRIFWTMRIIFLEFAQATTTERLPTAELLNSDELNLYCYFVVGTILNSIC